MVLGEVRIPTAGSQLRDSLNTDVQVFLLLSDYALRHILTQVLHRKSLTAVLWEREDVETHTVLPIEGPQRTGRGSEPFGR